MKRIVCTLAFAFLFATAAHAQMMKFNIPFGFTVGNKALPAGSYFITQPQAGIIRIANSDNASFAGVTVKRTFRDNPDHKNVLIFEKTGDHYMLCHILTPDVAAMNVDLPKWNKDQKLREAKNEKRGEEVELVASVVNR